MIRLFTALEVPASAAERLCTLQSGLRGARWISPENFHITLRFIGDVSEDTAFEIDEALMQIEAAPFDLQLDGLGSFGHSKPHALWAGVAESETLARAAGEAGNRDAKAGAEAGAPQIHAPCHCRTPQQAYNQPL